MFVGLALGEVDIGLRVVWLDELVANVGMAVVLIAGEPGVVQMVSWVVLLGVLPDALAWVDANNLLLLLKGDMAREPGQ